VLATKNYPIIHRLSSDGNYWHFRKIYNSIFQYNGGEELSLLPLLTGQLFGSTVLLLSED